jgi:hypothetical protein
VRVDAARGDEASGRVDFPGRARQRLGKRHDASAAYADVAAHAVRRGREVRSADNQVELHGGYNGSLDWRQYGSGLLP